MCSTTLWARNVSSRWLGCARGTALSTAFALPANWTRMAPPLTPPRGDREERPLPRPRWPRRPRPRTAALRDGCPGSSARRADHRAGRRSCGRVVGRAPPSPSDRKFPYGVRVAASGVERLDPSHSAAHTSQGPVQRWETALFVEADGVRSHAREPEVVLLRQ